MPVVFSERRLNALPVNAVKTPDEAQHLEQIAGAVRLAGPEYARDGTPGAGPARPVEPEHQIGAR